MSKFIYGSMVVAASLTLTCIAACDDKVAETKAAESKVEKPNPKIELTEGEWSDVKKYVAEQKGKVVVVDLWSTSCLPCMTEFPNLVKLQKKYGKKIVCVSFNLDYAGIKSKPPIYYRPRVEQFLQSRNAEFRNIMSTVDAIEVFDSLKLNSIPAVLVYGKDGKLAKRFDESLLQDGEEEAFTYEEDINPFVQKLME